MTQFHFLQRKQMEQQRGREMKWEQKKRSVEYQPEWEQKVMRANFNAWLYIFRPICNNYEHSLVQPEYWGNLSHENCLHKAPAPIFQVQMWCIVPSTCAVFINQTHQAVSCVGMPARCTSLLIAYAFNQRIIIAWLCIPLDLRRSHYLQLSTSEKEEQTQHRWDLRDNEKLEKKHALNIGLYITKNWLLEKKFNT